MGAQDSPQALLAYVPVVEAVGPELLVLRQHPVRVVTVGQD